MLIWALSKAILIPDCLRSYVDGTLGVLVMFGPFPSERVILSSHCARHCFPPLLIPTLLDFTLEILPSDQIRDIVVVILVLLASFLLLQALIALRQFPQRSQAVRA